MHSGHVALIAKAGSQEHCHASFVTLQMMSLLGSAGGVKCLHDILLWCSGRDMSTAAT